MIADAWKDAAESFNEAEIGPDGLDEVASGVPRPTATWTYLVNDNPFGTEADRILGRLRNAIKPDVDQSTSYAGADAEDTADAEELELPEELAGLDLDDVEPDEDGRKPAKDD